MKNIILLILIAAAIWIFWGYTRPIYEKAGGLREVRTDYENKLAQANEFRQKYEDLATQYQSFSETDLANLSRLVPDKVDAIRLVIEVSDIAARQGLLVKDIAINESAKEKKGKNNPEEIFNVVAVKPNFSSVDLSFSVTGSYERFVAFLQDLEKSLRILDVTEIKFETAENSSSGNSYDFSLGLRAYWLE